MPNSQEEEISLAVLKIAAIQPNGIATFKRAYLEVPKFTKLSPSSKAPSGKRPGEVMWQQIVRNIKSHNGKFIKMGYLQHVSRVGYRITPAGKAYLSTL